MKQIKYNLKQKKNFFEKFKIFKDSPKEMQERLFKNEEQQEKIKVTNSTELFYLKDKIYEFAYLNKMAKGASFEELDKLEDELNKVYQEIEIKEIDFKKDEEYNVYNVK